MSYDRGAVVEAGDPFKSGDSTRPFVIANDETHPFHGEQYVALTLTTRSWYEGTIPLSADDFVTGGVPAESRIVPWGVVSPAHEDVRDQFGRIEQSVVDDAVDRLSDYLKATDG